MKQYKLLKDLPGLKTGAIFQLFGGEYIARCENGKDQSYWGNGFGEYFIQSHKDWFEEIKEEKKGRCLTEPEKGEIVWIARFLRETWNNKGDDLRPGKFCACEIAYSKDNDEHKLSIGVLF